MKANKNDVLMLLKTMRGQIDGIIKMVEEDRYCTDISNQLLAIEALASKANRTVLKAHLLECVKDSVENGNLDTKVDELVLLIDKMAK